MKARGGRAGGTGGLAKNLLGGIGWSTDASVGAGAGAGRGLGADAADE